MFNAIVTLEKNINKICWWQLSLNPNARSLVSNIRCDKILIYKKQV